MTQSQGVTVARVLAGSLLFCAAAMGTEMGTVIRSFVHDGSEWLTDVAISPDGSQVLTGPHSGEVWLWDIKTGNHIRTFSGVLQNAFVAFSPDGTKVLTGGRLGTHAYLWNATTGDLIHDFHQQDAIDHAVFSPDGTKVYTGGFIDISTHPITYGTSLFDAVTGNRIRDFSENRGASYLAYSPDGTMVLNNGSDDTSGYVARLYNSSTGSIIRIFENVQAPVAFMPDGARVLVRRQNDILLMNIATGTVSKTFTGNIYAPNVALSRDGATMVTATSSGGGNNSLILWDVATAGILLQISVPPSLGLALSADGTKALTTWGVSTTASLVAVAGKDVPDVVGQEVSAAQSTITNTGLTVGTVTQQFSDTVAAGFVISQSPAAGELVPDGSAVSLVSSLGLPPPSGTIVINGNRSVTNNPVVTLTLTWTGGVGVGPIGMRFSNDGATWSTWEPPQSPRTYTLPGGDGYKTVRVQFKDSDNNRSAVANDYIRLDTTPPTGSIVINGGMATTASQSVSLGLKWADGTGAGVTRMRFSDNGSNWTAWEIPKATVAHTLPAGLGYHTVRVQYLDGGNNYSAIYNDYIKLVAP